MEGDTRAMRKGDERWKRQTVAVVGEERESEEQKKRRNEVETCKSRFPRMPRQEHRERNQGIIMTIPYYHLERLTKRQDIKGENFFFSFTSAFPQWLVDLFSAHLP